MDAQNTSSNLSKGKSEVITNAEGDDIIELLHHFLTQSPSDFSITILPTNETTSSDDGTSKSNNVDATPSLDFSIVLVDNHLGMDARSLPWITRDLRKAYKRLRKHYDKYDVEGNTAGENLTLTEQMIQATECLLLVNPDHSTVWADRRRALLRKSSRTKSTLPTHNCFQLWKNEIAYLDLLFTQHSKAPTSWGHRKYCLRQISILCDDSSRSDIVRHEIEICAQVAEKYPKNYYAWTHRMYIWTLFFPTSSTNGALLDLKLDLLQEEMDTLWKWLRIHPSDHSAVHYISIIIDLALTSQTTDCASIEPSMIHKHMIDLVTEHTTHESMWILRRIVSKIFWQNAFVERVVDDVKSIVDDLRQKQSCPDNETRMSRYYGLTFVAWCYAMLQIENGTEKLLPIEDVQMIVNELSSTDVEEHRHQFWTRSSLELLGLSCEQ